MKVKYYYEVQTKNGKVVSVCEKKQFAVYKVSTRKDEDLVIRKVKVYV